MQSRITSDRPTNLFGSRITSDVKPISGSIVAIRFNSCLFVMKAVPASAPVALRLPSCPVRRSGFVSPSRVSLFRAFAQSHRVAGERRIFAAFRFALGEQFLAAFQLRRVLLFLGAQAGEIFRDVVAVLRGDAMPHRPDFLDGLVCCVHVSMSPSNSGGVTSSGVFNPSRVLIRRMWPNLLAFARCRQFQVTK